MKHTDDSSATRALSAARSSPNESRMIPKKRLSHSVATITQKASEYTVAVAYRGCGGVIRSSDSPMSPRRIPSDITVTQHESTSWHGEPSAANSSRSSTSPSAPKQYVMMSMNASVTSRSRALFDTARSTDRSTAEKLTRSKRVSANTSGWYARPTAAAAAHSR